MDRSIDVKALLACKRDVNMLRPRLLEILRVLKPASVLVNASGEVSGQLNSLLQFLVSERLPQKISQATANPPHTDCIFLIQSRGPSFASKNK